MLITFEGIDGSGKSTQARRLVERLEADGVPVLFVREPGGTEVSERIRTLLLDPALDVDPFAELLLFSAARAQLVAERIRPALDAGHLVLADRFFDSTIAYQGAGRGLEDVGWLRDFQMHVTGGLVPARTYLFEIDPTVAHARRQGQADRMEAAGEVFLGRVAAAYSRLAEAEPQRFLCLDATASIDALHARLWADLQAHRTARNTPPA